MRAVAAISCGGATDTGTMDAGAGDDGAATAVGTDTGTAVTVERVATDALRPDSQQRTAAVSTTIPVIRKGRGRREAVMG
jgi:hypothetical protein